jgi:hypothetical protein
MKKIIIFSIIPLLAFIVYAAAGSKSYESYLAEKKRVISREVVDDKVLTTFAQGRRTWVETNTLNRVTQRTAPIVYSKLKLIVAAKEAGKWQDVKSAIKAMDLEDEWNACQFITSDYPAYVSATNTVISMGIASEAEVKAFMKKAED